MTAAGRTAGVVIIGAGHAGGRTAERLRHGGYVGPIDVVGIERELPYERPPLSKGVLTAPEVPANAYLLPASKWAELGVKFHLGCEALWIDRVGKAVTVSNGTVLPYRKVVIATGLVPRRLPALAPVAANVIHLRTFQDAVALRQMIGAGRRAVLIGAGLIGLETAASAVKRGAAVTVIEAADRPLSRFVPAYLAAWLAGLHAAAGVDIRCGRRVVDSADAGGVARLVLDNGAHIEADLVLVGIGGVPNDRIARNAGLSGENGVVVNEFGQTSDPDIFAVGDVAAHFSPLFARRWRLESWKNAEDMAAVAAAHICGSAAPYVETPWFWTDQYDHNIQVAGVPGDTVPSFERGRPGDRGYLAYFVEDGRLRGAIGIGCGRDVRLAREAIKAGGRVDPGDLAARGFAATAARARRAS
ncbi:MAG: FAD-dependent oxidoreductase [Rhizobiaceae bacterium]|nr:FAD-dependent oxidoreductase [Rhizobiaceae bacterium]